MENTKRDLFDVLKLSSRGLRFAGIMGTTTRYLNLRLQVRLVDSDGSLQFLEIICKNAVDYVIRPRDPNCLEGGPLIELHEQHPWLDHPGLQGVPGGDGEMFDPPLKFRLLILEQTHVIAEKFEIQPWKPIALDDV